MPGSPKGSLSSDVRYPGDSGPILLPLEGRNQYSKSEIMPKVHMYVS